MKIQSDIRIMDSAQQASIDIEGVIGVPEQMQFGSADERVATYARFAASLAAIKSLQAPQIIVNIRSTGGDVNDALLIYEALRESEAKVITRCYGYVASAATIIAQAASEGSREISSSALYLIHCSESAAEGNAQTLSAAKELLDRTDERIAALYAGRSGRDSQTYMELMRENGGKGKWITAREAVGYGLADKVISQGAINEAGFLPGDSGDDIAELCRMFGLEPPPLDRSSYREDKELSRGMKERVKSLWRLLSRLFADADKTGESKIVPRKGEVSEAVSVNVPFTESLGGGSICEGSKRVAKELSEPKPEDERETSLVPELPGDASLNGHERSGSPQDRTAVSVLHTLQSEAFATVTKAVEDPALDEKTPSPNQQAYIEDALNMRRHA